MSRSVFLYVEALMFEIVSLLSIIERNMNKNPIWSILVFCAISLYLLPMESSVIEATYDVLRVISKWETDIRWHFGTNCWILIFIAHYNINIILIMICYKLRFVWEVYCKLGCMIIYLIVIVYNYYMSIQRLFYLWQNIYCTLNQFFPICNLNWYYSKD